MRHAPEGWAFLVARGRRAGYRTVLAPAFLVDGNEHHVLAESTGADGDDRDGARLVELATSRGGPFTVGYTSERLACADVEPGAADGVLAMDEHGRPLEVVYGVVSRDRLDGPLDAEDLRTARAHALTSYRSFLADEQGHRVDASVPFALRTRGRPRADGAAEAPAAAGTPAPTPAPATGRRRPGTRAIAVIAATIGCALIIAGAVILSSRDQQAFAVSRAWLDGPPVGDVRYCVDQDVSGWHARSAEDFNRRFPGSSVVLQHAGPASDASPDRRLGGCDVVYLDVVSTSELAAKDLLFDMTPYLTPDRRAAFDDRILRTAKYGGRLWGVPKQLDVGVLYYRTDRVLAPRSWSDVFQAARRRRAGDPPGLRLGAGSPEGLTVVVLELAYAAGARPIITADGKRADIDQPAMLAALMLLRSAIRDDAIPRVAQSDGGALHAYETGRASFLRSWPFAAARIRADARRAPAQAAAARNTEIVALPPWRPGGRSISVLGGHNLVIPRAARNPSAALWLVDFLTSYEQIRRDVLTASQIPVLKALAEDRAVRSRPVMRAVERTAVVSRPAIPQYARVSRIISAGVTAVLRDRTDGAWLAARLRAIDGAAQRVLDER